MSLNINHCTLRTLVNTTGITLRLATAIIDYRKQKENYPITDFKELWNIQGMTKLDFQAITSEYSISPAPITVKSVSPSPITNTDSPKEMAHTDKKNTKKSPRARSRSTSQKRNSTTVKNRNKRKKKRKNKRQNESRASSPSPIRGGTKRDVNRSSKTLDSIKGNNRRNRRRGFSPANSSTLESSKSGRTGRVQVPNLFLSSENDSPHNTLTRLTAGQSDEPRKVFTPFRVEASPDGNGLIVMYKEANHIESENIGSKSNPATFPQDASKRKKTKSTNTHMRHQSDDSSKSRKSISSPPDKRSRSSPARANGPRDGIQHLEDWGSNVPFGPGSSTLENEPSVPVSEGWVNCNYRNVRNWLATVQDANIITDTTRSQVKGKTHKYNSADALPCARKRLDLDGEEAGPSGVQNTNISHHGNPSLSDADAAAGKKKIASKQSPDLFTSKQLMDTWQATRSKSRDPKKHHKADHIRSRQKSRHRWNNRVGPLRKRDEDERRPVESRLDRSRDRSMDLSEEMRRINKHALERRQSRHRHRSRARSRDRRRRLFNCSIM